MNKKRPSIDKGFEKTSIYLGYTTISKSSIPHKMVRAPVIVTKHAQQRMRERGFDTKLILSWLKKLRNIELMKNKKGYEICVPFKGMLAGNFHNSIFYIKTALFPRFGRFNNYHKTLRLSISSICVR